jgi:hypothetical protein
VKPLCKNIAVISITLKGGRQYPARRDKAPSYSYVRRSPAIDLRDNDGSGT